MKVGAIEAGGTKFVCAIGNEHNEIIERVAFPTTTPEETLAEVFAFFDQHLDGLKAIGIGSFGPIEVRQNSSKYGQILSTPKLAWKNFDFLAAMKVRYDLPMAWTTDVNAAAVGEASVGAAKGLDNMLYVTVGTGVGVGALVNGKLLEGLGHPEMGHVIVHPHPADNYAGFCPYHGNCLEGMAAGPSIDGRLGVSGKDVAPDDAVWTYVANYLGQALVDYTLILRPERIVIGGGNMKVPGMLDKIKDQFDQLMADYVEYPDLADYIVLPGLGDDAGITGALTLANQVK